MSQRPINILEIKSNFSKAMTEASASFETIFADLAGKLQRAGEEIKVLQSELEAQKAENTRLQKPKEVKKVPSDDSVTPPKPKK